MKNLNSSLCLVALVSVIYLLFPCNMLAQDGGDPPCCFNSPSVDLSIQFIGSPASAPVKLFDLAFADSSTAIDLQYRSQSRSGAVDIEALNLLWAKDREIYARKLA